MGQFCPNFLQDTGKKHNEAITGSSLSLNALIDSSFWFNTINLGWSIVYIEGSQLKIKYCISFSKDHFCLGKQCICLPE